MDIELLKDKTSRIFEQHGIIRASVFGSVARGEDKEGSDVDLLIEPKRPYGLVQAVSLKRGLEAVLNKPVDVVEYGTIKPSIEKNILKDQTVIYEQR